MPRLLYPSWRWMTISGTPSQATSTAWAWRSWCGAKRRRTPAAGAVRRSWARAAAVAQGRPPVVPLMTQNSGPEGSSRRRSSQGWSSCHPQSSMPTSRRRPPLPRRTSSGHVARRVRPRCARALPGLVGRLGRGSRSDRGAGGRGRHRRRRASRRRSPRPSANPLGSAVVCRGRATRQESRRRRRRTASACTIELQLGHDPSSGS